MSINYILLLQVILRIIVQITPHCTFPYSTLSSSRKILSDLFIHHFYILYPSQAAEMGLWETGWCALRVLRHGLLAAAGGTSFLMSNTQVKYQVSCFYLFSDPAVPNPTLS